MKKNRRKKKNIIKIVLVIILLIPIIIFIYRAVLFPRKFKDIVEKASDMYNIDPNLIYAVIKQESKFNEQAVSCSGAKGLMQIMDTTAKDVSKGIDSINPKDIELFDPYTNIMIGTKYLSYLTKHFNGNYYLAITAYNAGLGKVEKWAEEDYKEYTDNIKLLNIIEYEETKNYVTRVIKYYDYYTKIY